MLAVTWVTVAFSADECLTSQGRPGQSPGSQGLMVHSAN